jgi:predicted transcriptional regulator
MEDTSKTLISLRLPTTLLKRVDDEAKTNRRSRAFIITDAVEKLYPNGKASAAKPKPKVAAKKAVAKKAEAK